MCVFMPWKLLWLAGSLNKLYKVLQEHHLVKAPGQLCLTMKTIR
uniref:Knox7 n=1 Tax=Arundo donax TaxID=35708 RepID=A0A0A9R9T0_ARUDO